MGIIRQVNLLQYNTRNSTLMYYSEIHQAISQLVLHSKVPQQIPYNGNDLRKKTFVNFAILHAFANIFLQDFFYNTKKQIKFILKKLYL